MPIINKIGDLLTDSEVNVLGHQTNLFCVFGAGIARAIKDKYPEAYDADCATPKGDTAKLGTYSSAATADGKIIVNCYSQTGMGASDNNTSYNHIFVIFKTLEEKIRAYNDKNPMTPKVIGVPYGFGSSLAGGRWTIVEAIFQAVFQDSPVKFIIVKLSNQNNLK